ncbi:MAG: bifunctional diaminohydroxyphosphoribosylaminopyrimidine deaminase/5-amino-6-(5-phosphoribosylamino)uracil reductase RibD, partial [Pseudomonadota bacterium]
PLVNGNGFKALAEAGMAVKHGLMQAEARAMNPGFISRFERGRPWVRAKIAGSLDGRTTGPDGRSKWITSKAARCDGHRWRARASAVLTGINTILADDPRLNIRLDTGEKTLPVIVLDSQARLSSDAAILNTESARVIQFTTRPVPTPLNAESIVLPADPNGLIPIEPMLQALAQREINTVHVEAGATLTGSLLMGGWIDELIVYQANSLIGAEGSPLVRLPGMEKFDQRLHMQLIETRRVGGDWRLRYRA